MSKFITQVYTAIALLVCSGMASASVVPVSEPGPFGLLAMSGLALLIASRVKRNK